MSKKKRKTSAVLKEVRDIKYRQRIVPDKKKELKKNPPLEDSFREDE